MQRIGHEMRRWDIRQMYRILVLLFLSLQTFVAGCASSRGSGSTDTEELLGREVTEGRVVEGKINPPGEEREGQASRRGYRVQVMASKVREEAEGVSGMVKNLFPVAVYVERSDPFYRVRVGDFRTKEEAEVFREKLSDFGFKSAWVVETEISTE